MRQVESDPLYFFGTQLKQVSSERYLGCWLAGTVAQSIETTVARRIGPAYQSIYEARIVVQDARANAVGSLTLMLDIFEKSIIPSLLYGCETWKMPLPKRTLDSLNKLSHSFLETKTD